MATVTYNDLKDPWDDYYIKSIIRGSEYVNVNTSDPPRSRSESKAMSIRDFCNMIWLTLKVVRPGTRFIPGYPKYVITNSDPTWITGPDGKLIISPDAAPDVEFKSIPAETITWAVHKQEPGAVGDRAFGSTREIKPRVREVAVRDEYATEQGNGYVDDVIQTKAQVMDNIVQFDICAKDNSSAEDLVERFKKFMVDYTGVFQQRGIVKMHFDERLRDEFVMKWRNGLVNRTLRWYVRTEEVWAERINRIKQINIEVEKLKSDIIANWERIGQTDGDTTD